MKPTQPTRVALYARFSTDLQRQTSIADQLLAARDRAAREGWQIVAEHADEGVSGSVPVILRRGGKALLADALAARFDVLIVEGLDRLSRDMGEQDQVVKRLEYRNVRLIGTSDGYDTQAKGRKVMRVARGLVNELYLDDLRDKTHRGLAGQFGRGLSAGGRSFGYRTEAVAGGRRMVIDEAEAAHVRWVFEQVADGHSPRAIVHQLNRLGVASARGGTWAVSAIVGSSVRGLGMLHNELYIGRVIWNRRQWLKDPETGSRRYIERPRNEWQVREAPELRIVSEELWQRVRAASTNGPARGARAGRGASPKTLFGGLLRCNTCAGAIVAIDSRHYGCSVHKDRGSAVCASGSTWPRTVVDRRLVAEVRDELLRPEAIDQLQRTVRAVLAESLKEDDAAPDASRRRLLALRGEIERLVDAVARSGYSAALAGRLQAAEAEADAIEGDLRRVQAPTVDATRIAAQVVNDYRRTMLQLQDALTLDDDRQRIRQILADLLGAVTLLKDDGTGESFAEFEEPAERLLLAVSGQPLGRVARAGFEPATFGL